MPGLYATSARHGWFLSGAALLILAVVPAFGQNPNDLLPTTGWRSAPAPCPQQPCPTPVIVTPTPKVDEKPTPTPTPTPMPITEPTAAPEFAQAGGGGAVSLADSGVGYIDPAMVQSQFRFRFDSNHSNNRPDRAEYLYPKHGTFRLAGLDPDAQGPPVAEQDLSYQEYLLYTELAWTRNFSTFIELSARAVNGQILDNTTGLGDSIIGFKWAVVNCCDRIVTFQFKTYIPTGDPDKGLGTSHVSLEPGLLGYRRIGDRGALESQARFWIPVSGTDYAGSIFIYGLGASYRIYQSCSGMLAIAPVAEVVGWQILGGMQTIETGPDKADGIAIVNGKLGVRTFFGDRSSLYLGYGRPFTGSHWYEHMWRIEYRLAF